MTPLKNSEENNITSADTFWQTHYLADGNVLKTINTDHFFFTQWLSEKNSLIVAQNTDLEKSLDFLLLFAVGN